MSHGDYPTAAQILERFGDGAPLLAAQPPPEAGCATLAAPSQSQFNRALPAAPAAASGASVGSARSASLLNLDYRTYDAQRDLHSDGEWYVQSRQVGGYAEFIAVEDEDRRLGRRAARNGERVRRSCDEPLGIEALIDEFALERKADKAKVAARRAKRNLKWKMLSLGADRIWTLTVRGGIETRASAWALWSQFERYCSRKLRAFEYIVVIEQHHAKGANRGTFHIHFATSGFLEVSAMRLWWHRILTGQRLTSALRGDDSPGNVHVSAVGQSRKLGRYLAKYLGKDFEADEGKRVKRFAASKGIIYPQAVRSRMHARMGEHVRTFRRLVEAQGWEIEAEFETVVVGRRLVWVQCRWRGPRAVGSA